MNQQDGSLAVENGREVALVANDLLSFESFAIRIATQDWHPEYHISFARNHPPPNNRPFESFITMANPAPGKETQTKPQQLWPVHCVSRTKGASIIPEVETNRIDLFVKKGLDPRVEMYSAFEDAFENTDSTKSVDTDLKGVLRAKNVTDVFIVGLAGDYCVKCTALDAVKAGFKAWVVEEGTKCVVPGLGWETTKEALKDAGVRIVSLHGPEIEALRRV